MSDFSNSPVAAPLHIGGYTLFGSGSQAHAIVSPGSAAITWVANLAVYIPIVLPFPYPLRRLWWINGSTITTSNADVGIYSPGGAAIARAGTTALAGASAQQYVALGTEVLLSPGRYYLAYVCSGTTSRAFGTTSWGVNALRFMGVLQQALGSASLPASMTPATIANALFPLCGITQTSSGF